MHPIAPTPEIIKEIKAALKQVLGLLQFQASRRNTSHFVERHGHDEVIGGAGQRCAGRRVQAALSPRDGLGIIAAAVFIQAQHHGIPGLLRFWFVPSFGVAQSVV